MLALLKKLSMWRQVIGLLWVNFWAIAILVYRSQPKWIIFIGVVILLIGVILLVVHYNMPYEQRLVKTDLVKTINRRLLILTLLFCLFFLYKKFYLQPTVERIKEQNSIRKN